MSKPKTIDEYIGSFSPEVQKKLEELWACLREVVPDAKESLKWGHPAFSHDWILFQFAAFKNHISLYPTPSVIKALQEDMKDHHTSASTIQFSLDKPLPLSLIKKIVRYRLQEAKNGIKWM